MKRVKKTLRLHRMFTLRARLADVAARSGLSVSAHSLMETRRQLPAAYRWPAVAGAYKLTVSRWLKLMRGRGSNNHVP